MSQVSLAGRRIPASTEGPLSEAHVPVLIWVHSGTATIEAAGVTHSLSAGEALWVPPRVMRCVRSADGGVVLSIFLPLAELPEILAGARIVTIPEGWEDWLIFLFDWNAYHSIDTHSDSTALLSLVAGSAGRPRSAEPVGFLAPWLPMPRSAEAREAARTLIRSPSLPWRVEELADRARVSARTLQRQFRHETGMAFSRWRTRARVVVAASHLVGGCDVGWARRHTGYATPAGFTRAFHRHFGMSPKAYRERARRASVSSQDSADAAARHMWVLLEDEAASAPSVPPRHVWDWVLDRHVLWWACRGKVRLRIGSRSTILRRGEAIWLPAGLSASVEDLADGSILLPLGERRGGKTIRADDLTTFSFPEKSDAFLLHTVLIEYTSMSRVSGSDRLVDELFQEQFFGHDGESAPGLSGAVATIAGALRRAPADSRSLAEWAAQVGLSPQALGREFRVLTGSSFPHWRGQLRMSRARDLLRSGSAPREVAAALGYATLSGFSDVFTAAHGLTPRRYQQRVSGQLGASPRSHQARGGEGVLTS